MAKKMYVSKTFTKPSLVLIDRANEIIEEYMRDGYVLTLRQLYYQFVSRDWISNKVESYDKLGKLISNARIAGLIDWEAIEDRTRSLQSNSHWSSPSEIVTACANQYQIDKWEGQPYQPEVWVEKEALAGVVEGVCRKLDVPFFSCRGYTSQSEMWRAGVRLKEYAEAGRNPVIIHLGDHDPSGIDMTRDIHDRIDVFSEHTDFILKRIALNMDQVRALKLPPNPAKTTDARFADYEAKYGESSWELDALEPRILSDLIEETVVGYRSTILWDKAVKKEESHRELLREIANAAS